MVHYLAGILNTIDALKFKRLIYRITRGTTLTNLMDVNSDSECDNIPFIDPESGEVLRKTVFLIIYTGGT